MVKFSATSRFRSYYWRNFRIRIIVLSRLVTCIVVLISVAIFELGDRDKSGIVLSRLRYLLRLCARQVRFIIAFFFYQITPDRI